jgi:archaellum component FlaF (FlaF/FlaG flagellin family)
MGFSLVAATAIIGVALVMAIEIIVGTTFPTMTDVHESLKDMKNRAIDQIQTEISITDVTSTPNGSNYDINITIDNLGSVTLETEYFNILINGTQNAFICSKPNIYPENEVYFNVFNYQNTGLLRLKVVTDNGISDYYDFTIP